MMGYPSYDYTFVSQLERQREWSERTFGPGPRLKGVCDHIRKEVEEVLESDGALDEWVDIVLLALDGCWRSGAKPEDIANAIKAKQQKNEDREWPDWRTRSSDEAIEHDRTQEASEERRLVYELLVPPSGDQTLTGYQFESEERAEKWLDQQGGRPRKKGYIVQPVMVKRCECCAEFHADPQSPPQESQAGEGEE